MARRHTNEEIVSALNAFEPAEKAKIKAAAIYFSGISKIPAEDLVQSATVRLLVRSCRSETSVLVALIGMIRSIASGARKKEKLTYVDPNSLSMEVHSAWSPGSTSPEDEALAKIQLERAIKLIDEAFSDRPILRKLAHGRCLGLNGKELQEFAGLDNRMIVSNLKSLNRHLSRLKDRL